MNRFSQMTFLIVFGLTALASAQTFTTLYSFTGGTDGSEPAAGMIRDLAGNLYGTTSEGGDLNCNYPYGCGAVYRLNPAGIETVLHSFSETDGQNPYATVIRDSVGNIYGTTANGGNGGTVFKIDTAGNETVLHSFSGGTDGSTPWQGLVMGKSGAVFGTTAYGGSSYVGTVFKVSRAGKFTLLHTFTGGPSDGAEPINGHLTMDKSGNLYGATTGGGANNGGMLYRLSQKGRLSVLHSFQTSDGGAPYGTVVVDKLGNLYGTAYTNDYGTIWKLSKGGKMTILHNFAGGTSDGCSPTDGVARDSKGNLYGVTPFCGANSAGVLYELSASGKYTVLHNFDLPDGRFPVGEVVRTSKGKLFGVTSQGGTGNNCYWKYACGTVWSYVP